MNHRISLRAEASDPFLCEIERESIALFHAVKAVVVPGAWEPSPVEEKYQSLRELLVTTPGILRGFRHSFLAAGRLNFPDSPIPKEYYLEWDDRLSGQKRAGGVQLLSEAIRLYRHRKFRLADLDDNLVGEPTTYRVPKSFRDGMLAMGRRILKLRNLNQPHVYHVTEVKIRSFYYRTQLLSLLPATPNAVLEIGSGYGNLASELMQHLPIQRYFIVELPDAIPLAYFYLRARFDCPIQVFYHSNDHVDPGAPMVILPPWKLPNLDGEIDLLINTMSFQHMLPENVEFYINQADRLKAKYLYLVNRDTKRDPTDPIISRYPIPACYTAVYKKPWLFGPHLEILYRREK
jgi:hypothetical protein